MKHLSITRLYFTFFCSLFLSFSHLFAGSIPENAPFTTPSGENISEAGPLAVCLAYVYVAVGSSCDVTLTPEMIDGGSSDDDGDPLTFSLDNPGPYNPGVYTVFLTVSDGSSTNQCWSTVTVEDKMSPTAICVSNVNVSLGPDGTITALPEYIDAGSFDNCDIDLSISSGPTEFDCSDVGETFTLFLTVEDVGGNTNTCFSEVSIVDPGGFCANEAPVAVCISALNISVGEDCESPLLFPGDLDAGSFDPDGDPLTFSLDNPGPYIPGVYTVFLTVSDGSSTNQCWTTITVEDKTAPTAICLNGLSVGLGPDGTVEIFSEDLDGGSFDNCTSGLNYSGGDVTFSCADVGDTFELTLTVEDESGNTNSCFTEVNVSDPGGFCANEAPVAVCISALNISVGENCESPLLFPGDLDAGSFDPDGDPLTFSLDNPGPYIPGVYTVFLTVSDGSSTNQCWTTITVEDKTAPTAICLNGLSVGLGPDGTVEIFSEDLDGGSFDNCTSGLNYSGGDVTFSCADVGDTFELTLTVEDEYGNTNSCFTEVNVSDPSGFCANEAPVAVCLNGLSVSVGGDCESPLLFPADFDAGSFDPDGDPLTYSIDNEGPFAPGTYTVTLTVSDGSLSNSCSTQVQVTTPNNTIYEWIETVAVADLDNNSGDNGGYADFTALSTTLAIGNDYEIALTPGYAASSYTERWRVYIDFNQDGVFSNPAERVAQAQGEGLQLANILLPEGTLTGTTTMRVVMSYGDFENTCDDDFEGEVEDYTVVIANCEDIPGCISYCESEGQNTSYEWIRRVRLRSINNNSGDDGGYGDYTALSTNVTTGATYNMRLRPGFSGSSYQEYWRVWVDWNQDGDFSAAELMVQENGNGNIITSMTIPTAALAGSTRMRVAMQYNQYANACDNFGDGEVEDYSVNVLSTAGLIASEDEMAQAQTTDQQKQQLVNNPGGELPQLTIAIPDTRTLGLQLAPNPAKDVVNVSVKPLSENAELTIMDQVGRIVWHQAWSMDQQSQTLDLQRLGLANGVYFVSLQTAKEKITKRLVVTQ